MSAVWVWGTGAAQGGALGDRAMYKGMEGWDGG